MKTFETFLVEKGITKDVFTTKSAGEMAALYSEYNNVVRAEISAAIESKATTESVEKMKADFLKAKDEQFDSINAQLKSQSEELKQLGLTLKKVSLGGKEVTHSSIREGLEKNIEKLKALANGDRNSTFSIKAAGDMSISGNISGGNVPVEQRIAGFNALPQRRVKLLDIVSKGSVANSNLISWVYEANEDGTAGGTNEGALKNQIDVDFVVGSQAVVKQTAYIKATDEMLTDIDWMMTAINTRLATKLMQAVESSAYSGNGSAPNLNGIRTVSTAFAAGSFAGTVDNANEADVLVAAICQIKNANQPAPNYILMNPSDVCKLLLIKTSTTDRRYIDRLVMVAGNMSLDGVPIVETTLVTATEYLVGSFDLATLYSKGEVSIEIGYDGNDFLKNFKSIRAEWRGAMVVEHNFRTAFVKGDFDADKAALETP